MKSQCIQRALVVLMASSSLVLGQAQDYQGYDGQDQGYYEQQEDYYAGGEDSLYHDYAKHQEAKAQGGAG